ncbi:MAG: NAD(P)-binding protein [Chitinophagaceae bacterium]
MEKFDIIIVGAGASGLMAARILCESKMKVLLYKSEESL